MRDRIGQGEYGCQELLSSENTLVGEPGYSKDMVRQVIQNLADDGYVQSIHEKGVRIIYQPYKQPEFMLNRIESLKEAMTRDKKKHTTKVVCFVEPQVDEKIHTRTTFPTREETCYTQRVCYINGKVLIIDHSYFLKSMMQELTPGIAERSVCGYMEQVLGETVVTTKRKMTVERQTEIDDKCLDLRGYSCLTVVSSIAYNAEDVMLGYTQSRHRSGCPVFYGTAHRAK